MSFLIVKYDKICYNITRVALDGKAVKFMLALELNAYETTNERKYKRISYNDKKLFWHCILRLSYYFVAS